MAIKKGKAPTIKDVARAANVSITTVSRVMNNDPYSVNNETRERIKTVIKEMNYIPNAMARGIRVDRTKTIGLIIQDINNPYYPGIVRGVENAAQKAGFSLILADTQRSRSRIRQYLELMREKRVDGLVMAGGGIIRGADECRFFSSGGISTVVIGKPVMPDVVSVEVDNVAGGRLACEFLLESGHRNIASIIGAANSSTSIDREAGYRRALAANGIAPDKKWVVRGNFVYEGGYAAIDKLPLDGGSKITAIFAQNDLMAIGAINALVNKGYRVPEDISIIGFDGIPSAAYFMPSLTTLQIPFQEMGKKAVDILVRLMNGRRVETTTVLPVTIAARMTVRDFRRLGLVHK
ncbi:MAG: LacI family transcriptional regulator [Planctomycetota bacterium]|nr:LacI family transcriptional regulator [Planctomycetota bacterium]